VIPNVALTHAKMDCGIDEGLGLSTEWHGGAGVVFRNLGFGSSSASGSN